MLGEPSANHGASRNDREQLFSLEEGRRLAVALVGSEPARELVFTTDLQGPLVLHWGIAVTSRNDWRLPPESMRPAQSAIHPPNAVRTRFEERGGALSLRLLLADPLPRGIRFVLQEEKTGRWLKDHDRDFFVSLAPERGDPVSRTSDLAAMTEEIVGCETSSGSWTLKHRFDLCHDLLEELAPQDEEGLSLLFIWLRYSALRQLDWQRNFNTPPRELSHAQERLTLTLSGVYGRAGPARRLVRLLASCLGRGAQGQRVRDEILQIMHRHRIKEEKGHFLEEWHQKLHNNTTPDDVAICEAYLEFLRRDGDAAAFYRVLDAAGVGRARLESYERPIRSPPQFIPHLKDALLHELSDFLGVLKAVHSATDFGSSLSACRHLLGNPTLWQLDDLWKHREDHDPRHASLVEKAVEARRSLAPRLGREEPGSRDLLYLDLALEDFLRTTLERSFHLVEGDLGKLLSWSALTLESLLLSDENPELALGLLHLRRWSEQGGQGNRDWALHGQAILERLRRALAAGVDSLHQRLQPKAELLGKAFHAADWTVRLFAEEVVRGRLEFALSALLRRTDSLLRRTAGLGHWQLVSKGAAGSAEGRLEVAPSLAAAQEMRCDVGGTILVVDAVSGDEEIPRGVSAVLTPATIDLVSHLAVRARNAGVLLATCYDPELLDRFRSRRGQWLAVKACASGEVELAASGAPALHADAAPDIRITARPLALPSFSRFALSSEEFTPELVGAKSLNLVRLRGKLPGWIRLPASIALPFGVFERVLSEPTNHPLAQEHQALSSRLDQEDEGAFRLVLAKLRAVVEQLAPAAGLEAELRGALARSGLPAPEPWPRAWRCILQVWASKWNDRAFLSRRARGIPHQEVAMAVLVQQVVEANYGFVLHTANPFSGRRDEVFAELVPGLGEILVGNHPGRAMGASVSRTSQEIRIASFPSKSYGLYGRGLIFRSDSNAEDLAGYAGAGLYDSVTLEPPREQQLDYTREPLVWDEPLRAGILKRLCALGAEVEAVMGAPQDVEGTCTRDAFWVVQTRPLVGLSGPE
jgi:alpha-glucan,water dikinase